MEVMNNEDGDLILSPSEQATEIVGGGSGEHALNVTQELEDEEPSSIPSTSDLESRRDTTLMEELGVSATDIIAVGVPEAPPAQSILSVDFATQPQDTATAIQTENAVNPEHREDMIYSREMRSC